MGYQQNTAAGDETIGYIENRECDEVGLDHIHHITKAKPVDHIADAAAVDGCDEPALEIGEGPALAGEFPDDGSSEQNEYYHKQPLGALKRGEGGAGIAHIGQTQQTRKEVHMAVEGDVLQNQKFGKLICGNNAGRKECHP